VNLRQKEKENWSRRILFRYNSSQLPIPKLLYIHTLCTLAKGPLDDGIIQGVLKVVKFYPNSDIYYLEA
jgi:hypothetical protein